MNYVKRLQGMKERMWDREVAKEKLHLSRAISYDQYQRKKSVMDKSFKQKQKDFMYRGALERQTRREEQQDATVYYSLEMMNHSTPNQLPIHKVHP